MLLKWMILLACMTGAAQASSILSLGYQGDDLTALCNDRSVDLDKISQLESLVQQLDQAGSQCPERTAAALRALKKVIDLSRGDECSMGSFQRFREFYKEYLDTSDKERVASLERLPRAFKTFALAYGIELSGLCRANMVKILMTEAREAITEKDLEKISSIVESKGPLARQLSSNGKRPDELMLPSDFIAVIGLRGDKEKVGLKMQTTPIMKRIQSVCRRRFKPVYGPVMLPLAQMANLGFEHRGNELKKELKKSIDGTDTCLEVGRWVRIVVLCEGLDQIELIEEKKDHEQSDGNDATLVRVLTKEEAEATKAEVDGEDLLAKTKVNDDDIKMLEFKPSLSVTLPDKLLRSFDMKQKLSLLWFSTKRDEAANIRMRFFTKTFKSLLEDLRRFKLNSFLQFFFNKIAEEYRYLKRADKHGYQVNQQDITTQLVKAFNDRVDKELNPDLDVADDFDCPNCECPSCECPSCECCTAEACCCWMGSSYYGSNNVFIQQNNHYGNDRYAASRSAARKVWEVIGIVALLGLAVTVIVVVIAVVVVPSLG